MPLHNLAVKQKIALTLTSASASNIIPLFSYVAYLKSGFRLIEESIIVDNLKAIAWIYNLPAIEFPIFELEDTESKQLYTAINLEWNSPRFQLDILFNISSSATWHKIASYSLLNQSPYPFREYSLGNHALGNNSMIGFQIVDVGSGVLKTTNTGADKVTIIADITRQVFLEEVIENSQRVANSIGTVASIITNSNPSRKGITFQNKGTITVYLDTLSTVTIASHLIKLNPGAYYEAPTPVYTGDYWARTAAGTTSLEIREYF